jgi:hypothetical protein
MSAYVGLVITTTELLILRRCSMRFLSGLFARAELVGEQKISRRGRRRRLLEFEARKGDRSSF